MLNPHFDSHEKHIADTLKAGAGLCDPDVVQLVVKVAQARIEELQEWGVAFDTNKHQQLHLALEGGHSEKRIVHHKDQTGKAVQEALLAKAQTLPSIHLLAEHILVDLITEHHLPHAVRSCYGAYVISKSDQKVFCISSRITVLSTGGGGQFPWIDRVLLDNLPPKKLKMAVAKCRGTMTTEASGNITPENLLSYAKTGVDYISMGALNYAAPTIDLSLKIH